MTLDEADSPYGQRELAGKGRVEAEAIRRRDSEVYENWLNYKGGRDDPNAVPAYVRINSALRSGVEPDEFPLLMRPFRDHVLDRPARLHRGVRLLRGSTLHLAHIGLMPGASITDLAFMSTSATRAISESFSEPTDNADGFLFVISAPTGMRYVPIDFSGQKQEDEFVLPPGTRLFVVGVSRRDTLGRYIYDVVPFPPGWDLAGYSSGDPELLAKASDAWRAWMP